VATINYCNIRAAVASAAAAEAVDDKAGDNVSTDYGL